ncbi:HNH endonuclease signature motif containing protein [Peribacillus simplex]|uniref:HNH endonuclease n=1 Tax=Peribacillus simplex TaxID=1478 RepID=UPI003267C5CE
MDKLSEPSKSIKDYYLELIEKKRNTENNNFLKDRLLGIKDLLISEEEKYIQIARASNLHTLTEHSRIQVPKSAKEVTKDEMESLYTQNLVSKPNSGEIGRDVYDYLRSLALDKTCPYCSTTTAKTLDHYLPKAKFPMFAITPANLVPSCRDCNKEKDDKFSNKETEMFIHPYFEDVNSFTWLKSTVEDSVWPISFKYEVVVADDTNNILTCRLSKQQELLDLNNTFNDKANRQFRYRVKSVVKNYKAGGIDSVKRFFQESEESCRNAELNSWEACMYNALLNSHWFFSTALNQLEDRYGI